MAIRYSISYGDSITSDRILWMAFFHRISIESDIVFCGSLDAKYFPMNEFQFSNDVLSNNKWRLSWLLQSLPMELSEGWSENWTFLLSFLEFLPSFTGFIISGSLFHWPTTGLGFFFFFFLLLGCPFALSTHTHTPRASGRRRHWNSLAQLVDVGFFFLFLFFLFVADAIATQSAALEAKEKPNKNPVNRFFFFPHPRSHCNSCINGS